MSKIFTIASWLKFRRTKFAHIGDRSMYKHYRSTFSSCQNISIGNDVHIGPGATVDGWGGVDLGDGTIIGPNVTIYSRGHNFRHELTALPFDDKIVAASVSVGRYVWIGFGVVILPGVKIGDGAIIGAGAVVSKNVPDLAIVAGNPANVIGTRDREVFQSLSSDPANFVYTKHGHSKRDLESGDRRSSPLEPGSPE